MLLVLQDSVVTKENKIFHEVNFHRKFIPYYHSTSGNIMYASPLCPVVLLTEKKFNFCSTTRAIPGVQRVANPSRRPDFYWVFMTELQIIYCVYYPQ